MDLEFGMPVVDRDDQLVGTIGKIFMDSWTGKPRKYMVLREIAGPDTIYMVKPEQISEVSGGKARLTLTLAELEVD